VFEVEVDGELVFSKKATGRHANPDEVLQVIRQRAGS
jgi:selT/selW/selH-like putative selenoprotein